MTTSSTVTLATDDGPMPAYQARPAGAAKGSAAKGGVAKGGVVVVQEAFGVNAHMEDVTRRFAAAGWDTIAPAFFHRQGSPVLDYDDLATVMPLLGQMTPAGLAMDLTAAVDHLAAAGHAAENVAVVGFCMGGTVTFYAATLRPLGAAVTFYGSFGWVGLGLASGCLASDGSGRSRASSRSESYREYDFAFSWLPVLNYR
jgi:carboxymethylenebutenolidase